MPNKIIHWAKERFSKKTCVSSIIVYGVIIILPFIMVKFGYIAGILVGISPFLLLGFISILDRPFYSFILLFLLNYFVLAVMRYSYVEGFSVLVDAMTVVTLASVLFKFIRDREKSAIRELVERFRLATPVLVVALLWTIYCLLEILNPSAMLKGWVLSRALISYFFIFSLLTVLVFDTFKKIDTIMIILSGLTLVGILKGLMQMYIGFDEAEIVTLNNDLARTHLLPTGVRYFSIYASAGIFGPVMGHGFVVFGITAFYVKSGFKRAYYIFIALASFYGLLISGTRGAMAVPGAGFILFVLLSKRLQVIIPTTMALLASYLFLAQTYLGHAIGVIRRMRTLFDPKEPSLMVRLENQKKFGEYLADKPFGEGLGLSGVEAQSLSDRFTTSIPTDSWYVKIWVETGIVGLVLHICTLIVPVLYGAYLILFKIQNSEIRGTLTALLCGAVGILVSSYGNMILGQFPVAVIVYVSFVLVAMGPYFDKAAENSQST